MSQHSALHSLTKAQPTKEEVRVLSRLCERGVFLAMSENLQRGALLRTNKDGAPSRLSVVDRELATYLTMRDWIECTKKGQVAVYHVTSSGKAALRRILHSEVGGEEEANTGFAEKSSPFAAQHREFGSRLYMNGDSDKPQKLRVNLRESPIAMLARKKEKNGKPFLSASLLEAGERLREDFELSQMGPSVAQNWDRFLTVCDERSYSNGGGGGSAAAHQRLSAAMKALGPGLGDIALRCCCFLEGLEAAEKRMGWSARSGKVVLRIALQRLSAHYESGGEEIRKIG